MCLIVELLMFAGGLYALIAGKLRLTGKLKLTAWRARVAGLFLAAPLPLALTTGFLIGMGSALSTDLPNPEDITLTITICEWVIVFLGLAGAFVFAQMVKKQEPAAQTPSAPYGPAAAQSRVDAQIPHPSPPPAPPQATPIMDRRGSQIKEAAQPPSAGLPWVEERSDEQLDNIVQNAFHSAAQSMLMAITPGRQLRGWEIKADPNMPMTPANRARLEATAPSGRQHKIAVIAAPGDPQGLHDLEAKIPFLTLLLGFVEIGHAVVLFEGHPSLFERISRAADLVIVDERLMGSLGKDWAKQLRAWMPSFHLLVCRQDGQIREYKK